ncbi:hypothetical protein, partial [Paracidovorax wautersii]
MPQGNEEELRGWMQGSAAKGPGGEPLVLFHGTSAQFENFEGPAFFTDSLDEAREYGPYVMQVHVAIKRPKQLDSFGQMQAFQNGEIERYAALGYDGFIGEGAGGTHYFVFWPDQVRLVQASAPEAPAPDAIAESMRQLIPTMGSIDAQRNYRVYRAIDAILQVSQLDDAQSLALDALERSLARAWSRVKTMTDRESARAAAVYLDLVDLGIDEVIEGGTLQEFVGAGGSDAKAIRMELDALGTGLRQSLVADAQPSQAEVATPQSVRAAIAEVVGLDAVALQEQVGRLVITTSDAGKAPPTQSALDQYRQGGMVTLYHGTTPENASRLLRDGKTGRAPLGASGGSPELLYVTTDPENAAWFADQAGGGEVLVVQVPASQLRTDPEDGVHGTVLAELQAAARTGIPASLAVFGDLMPERIARTTDPTKVTAFQDWFLESKVVDAEGRPLRVFHGTAEKFTVFKGGRGGFYFTDDRNAAQAYAHSAESENDDAEPRVLDVYLSIKNPMVLGKLWYEENVLDEDGDQNWEAVDNMIYEAAEAGHDGLILRGFPDFDGMEFAAGAKVGRRMQREYDQYIVFRPEQIKSAVFNRGTYEPQNPDIRYSVGQSRRQTAFDRWFADSKVVDAQGQPLTVYHGTTADFTRFELDQELGQSDGFFFAGPESTFYVEGYVNHLLDGPRRTMPVHLSLQNPKVVESSWDGDTFANPDFENEQIAKAKLEGHDGVIFVEREAGDRFFVAFHPEQIKSAIGNCGTYDPNDPDIRHSLDAGQDLGLQAQAWHDASSNTTVFLADRIPAGREAAVFLHETVHRHGRQAMPESTFDQLVGQVHTWAQRSVGTVEREIYGAAARRVARARVSGPAADEELFAYA